MEGSLLLIDQTQIQFEQEIQSRHKLINVSFWVCFFRLCICEEVRYEIYYETRIIDLKLVLNKHSTDMRNTRRR